MAALSALTLVLLLARPVFAHVTKCPTPDPVAVELVQWWDVDTKTDTGGCSVSVNASDYDAAAKAGQAICEGEVRSVHATSGKANEPTRWTE